MLDETQDVIPAELTKELIAREARRLGKLLAAAFLTAMSETNVEDEEIDNVAKELGVDEDFGSARALLHSLAVGEASEVTLGEIASLAFLMNTRVSYVEIEQDEEIEEALDFFECGPAADMSADDTEEALGEDRGH